MTTAPNRDRKPNIVARWFRGIFWSSSEKYFQIPVAPAVPPPSLGERLYAWTGGAEPTAKLYAAVGAILVVLTALEYLVWRQTFSDTWRVGLLLGLVSTKLVVAIAFFMNMKFDHPVVRRVFGFGFILAVAIVLSVTALYFKLNG